MEEVRHAGSLGAWSRGRCLPGRPGVHALLIPGFSTVRHYYRPLYKSLVESGQWREAPPDPDHLLPETVAGTLDRTDVLLALWIAEATLDAEEPVGEKSAGNHRNSQ